MRVDLLTTDGFPHAELALKRVRSALDALEHEQVVVKERRIGSPAEAVAAQFAGSPTVLVNGVDVEPGRAPIESLACRVNRHSLVLGGAPSEEQVVQAIRSAQ